VVVRRGVKVSKWQRFKVSKLKKAADLSEPPEAIGL